VNMVMKPPPEGLCPSASLAMSTLMLIKALHLAQTSYSSDMNREPTGPRAQSCGTRSMLGNASHSEALRLGSSSSHRRAWFHPASCQYCLE
jgi:hypothetical protein